MTTTKRRVARLEQQIIAPVRYDYPTPIIHVPGGITRAEQQAFMDRCKVGKNLEGAYGNVWRIFIVGIPSD
jgi:hypothetical protein